MRREAKIATGIDPFDEAIPATVEWIDDLQKRLGWHDRSMAYLAAKATLHAFRDGLPPDEAVFLGGGAYRSSCTAPTTRAGTSRTSLCPLA